MTVEDGEPIMLEDGVLLRTRDEKIEALRRRRNRIVERQQSRIADREQAKRQRRRALLENGRQVAVQALGTVFGGLLLAGIALLFGVIQATTGETLLLVGFYVIFFGLIFIGAPILVKREDERNEYVMKPYSPDDPTELMDDLHLMEFVSKHLREQHAREGTTRD